MIALPFNDRRCLGTITEIVVDMVARNDELLAQLATEHPTVESLATWIRSLPQRDDLGEADDGPKVDECAPPQRLRLPAPDPNCVERAALYIAVSELIDPDPVRQFATLDTEIGLHTFPVENGAPVILDPRVPRNGLEMGLALNKRGPVAVAPRDAVEWTAQLAEAGAAALRNGPSRVRQARNAMRALVDEGVAPADAGTIDAIAWVLSLAERVARKYGPRVMAMVRSTTEAIAELADEARARTRRNLSLEIGGVKYTPAPWLSGLAQVAARVGVDVGMIALRAKLASFGIDDQMLGLVENELNQDGLTMGPLASKTGPATLATVAAKRFA